MKVKCKIACSREPKEPNPDLTIAEALASMEHPWKDAVHCACANFAAYWAKRIRARLKGLEELEEVVKKELGFRLHDRDWSRMRAIVEKIKSGGYRV